ncbi:hypothetical protein TNCV_3762681 [Trichonephila clavipes]|nr:hypothetical protein TNCV_3762681 [Trichonephila clavipes]
MFPSSPVPWLNCEEGEDIGGVAIRRKEVQPVSQALATFIPSLRKFQPSKSYCHRMVLNAKANDRLTSSPLP